MPDPFAASAGSMAALALERRLDERKRPLVAVADEAAFPHFGFYSLDFSK